MSIKMEKFAGNPILKPLEANPWESMVVTNPSAWIDDQTGQVMLLYRAAGHDEKHMVYFGLAASDDGFHFTRLSTEPVFSPGAGWFDGGCVEDPRVTKIGDWYYLTYASRPFPPGQYWLMADNPCPPPQCPADFPLKYRDNLTTTSLAMTKDWREFYRAGPLTHPQLDDRDVYLFPGKINDKYYMIHRPMEWAGPEYGTEHPAMWIVASDDLLTWDYTQSKLLAKAEYDWEVKIGGNTPPMETEQGWLTIYHGKGEDGYYRLGALLLDKEDPTIVTHRTRDWFLEPSEDYETQGCYDEGGVVFPCGKIVKDGKLMVYYGAADKYVGVASCDFAEFMDYLLACPGQ